MGFGQGPCAPRSCKEDASSEESNHDASELVEVLLCEGSHSKNIPAFGQEQGVNHGSSTHNGKGSSCIQGCGRLQFVNKHIDMVRTLDGALNQRKAEVDDGVLVFPCSELRYVHFFEWMLPVVPGITARQR